MRYVGGGILKYVDCGTVRVLYGVGHCRSVRWSDIESTIRGLVDLFARTITQ